MINKFNQFIFTILFITISNELLNMGLLIWASFQDNAPLKQTAYVGTCASLGYIFALFANKYTFKISFKFLMILTILISLPVISMKPMTLTWGFFLFTRSLLGQIIHTRIITFLPALVTQTEIASKNKNIQFVITMAGLFAMTISPILAKSCNLNTIIGISTIFLIFSLLFIKTLEIQYDNNENQSSNLKLNIKVKYVSYTSIIFYLSWIIFGTFFHHRNSITQKKYCIYSSNSYDFSYDKYGFKFVNN